MANQTKNRPKPGDATGRKKAELESQQAEEIAERQQQMAMATQVVETEMTNAVFDPRTGDKKADSVKEAGVQDFGVEIAEQEKPQEVVIRVNDTLTNVTIGAGTNYNFEEGKQYTVPIHVAQHLEEKGYVWH